MQKPTYIHKSFSWIIVLVILHTHWCSFSCSTGILSCCADEKERHEGDATHHEDEGCGDCQGEHLAFFKTLGQYHFLPADNAKVFQPLVAVILPLETVQPKDVFHTAEIYTGFHPPPPKAGTRILISSFQI